MIDYRATRNLPRMLLDRCDAEGDRPALWAKRGAAWSSLSWREFGAQVRLLARGLIALGVKPGERVALVAENRPEWLIADHAIMAAGAITVPAYTTNTVDDHRHVFANAGVAGAICSTRALAERALAAALQTPGCGFVVAIDPPKPAQDQGVRVLGWTDAMALGATRGDDVDAIAGGLAREDVACIIHTSGTGGVPKGVALSHGAILTNCLGAWDVLKKAYQNSKVPK